jgi:hypothetical protein
VKCSVYMLFVSYVVALFIYKPKQKAIMNFMQHKKLTVAVFLFRVMLGGNCDLFVAVTGLCGFCGR